MTAVEEMQAIAEALDIAKRRGLSIEFIWSLYHSTMARPDDGITKLLAAAMNEWDL